MTPPTLDDNPDAELIALGLDLEDACRRAADYRKARRSEDFDCEDIPAYNEADALVARIVELRATTLEGLRVKGKALHWFGGPVDPNWVVVGTEDEIIQSIAADVAAISEALPIS